MFLLLHGLNQIVIFIKFVSFQSGIVLWQMTMVRAVVVRAESNHLGETKQELHRGKRTLNSDFKELEAGPAKKGTRKSNAKQAQ